MTTTALALAAAAVGIASIYTVCRHLLATACDRAARDRADPEPYGDWPANGGFADFGPLDRKVR